MTTPPISHGICPACAARELADLTGSRVELGAALARVRASWPGSGRVCAWCGAQATAPLEDGIEATLASAAATLLDRSGASTSEESRRWLESYFDGRVS